MEKNQLQELIKGKVVPVDNREAIKKAVAAKIASAFPGADPDSHKEIEAFFNAAISDPALAPKVEINIADEDHETIKKAFTPKKTEIIPQGLHSIFGDVEDIKEEEVATVLTAFERHKLNETVSKVNELLKEKGVTVDATTLETIKTTLHPSVYDAAISGDAASLDKFLKFIPETEVVAEAEETAPAVFPGLTPQTPVVAEGTPAHALHTATLANTAAAGTQQINSNLGILTPEEMYQARLVELNATMEKYAAEVNARQELSDAEKAEKIKTRQDKLIAEVSQV